MVSTDLEGDGYGVTADETVKEGKRWGGGAYG
jgi:hypothetical protein